MKKNAAVAVIDEAIAKSDEVKQEETKVETPKELLREAEKIVRGTDRVISDLDKLYNRAFDLQNSTEINEKDYSRFVEMAAVIEASETILYHMTARMARKYVGKEILPIRGEAKRKSLKS